MHLSLLPLTGVAGILHGLWTVSRLVRRSYCQLIFRKIFSHTTFAFKSNAARRLLSDWTPMEELTCLFFFSIQLTHWLLVSVLYFAGFFVCVVFQLAGDGRCHRYLKMLNHPLRCQLLTNIHNTCAVKGVRAFDV